MHDGARTLLVVGRRVSVAQCTLRAVHAALPPCGWSGEVRTRGWCRQDAWRGLSHSARRQCARRQLRRAERTGGLPRSRIPPPARAGPARVADAVPELRDFCGVRRRLLARLGRGGSHVRDVRFQFQCRAAAAAAGASPPHALVARAPRVVAAQPIARLRDVLAIPKPPVGVQGEHIQLPSGCSMHLPRACICSAPGAPARTPGGPPVVS